MRRRITRAKRRNVNRRNYPSRSNIYIHIMTRFKYTLTHSLTHKHTLCYAHKNAYISIFCAFYSLFVVVVAVVV